MIETIEYTTAEYPKVTYAREPIPVAVLDGVPWWSTAHIQSLVHERFNPSACEDFDPYHVRAHRFPFDQEDELSHVISTDAAFWLLDARYGRKAYRWAASWLRKREKELRTAPPMADLPLLRLGANGKLPEAPFGFYDFRPAAWEHSLKLLDPEAYQKRIDDRARYNAEHRPYASN